MSNDEMPTARILTQEELYQLRLYKRRRVEQLNKAQHIAEHYSEGAMQRGNTIHERLLRDLSNVRAKYGSWQLRRAILIALLIKRQGAAK
jgi:hypothetical protein